MNKVMIFGTFDILHLGHIALIKEASKFGQLYVIIGTDTLCEKIKKRPYFKQEERQGMINAIKGVFEAVIGDSKDPYAVIKKIKPNTIVLGYDQKIFVDGLRGFLKTNKLNIKIKRAKGFNPKRYKSSKIKKYVRH